MSVKDKTVIITGGAQGIGLVTALEFLKNGANVAIIDINKEKVSMVIDSHLKFRGQLKGFTADITVKKEVEQVMKEINQTFDKIDVLINNAGITMDAQFKNMTEEQWDRVIDVNLKGAFNFTQQVIHKMIEQESGVILNASSVVGIYGNFGQSNYAASKFGINGLTKTWAKELGKYNIRVNSVAPGFILTDMTKKMPEKVLNSMKDKVSLRTLGTPEDIAKAYVFLASDDAKYITGTVLSVDGGLSL